MNEPAHARCASAGVPPRRCGGWHLAAVVARRRPPRARDVARVRALVEGKFGGSAAAARAAAAAAAAAAATSWRGRHRERAQVGEVLARAEARARRLAVVLERAVDGAVARSQRRVCGVHVALDQRAHLARLDRVRQLGAADGGLPGPSGGSGGVLGVDHRRRRRGARRRRRRLDTRSTGLAVLAPFGLKAPYFFLEVGQQELVVLPLGPPKAHPWKQSTSSGSPWHGATRP